MGSLPDIDGLAELRQLVESRAGLHVRYSKGPDHDGKERSVDYESGLPLPGLSANPLSPEPWWSRPVEDWLARQLCQYDQLQRAPGEVRDAWVIEGTLAGRGPDSEPLLREVTFVARITDRAIDEARRRYEERFDVGRSSRAAGSAP